MDIVGISSDEQVWFSAKLYWKLVWFILKSTFIRTCWDFLQDAIFRVVAAILHLGNVEFVEGSEADSSVPKDDKSKFHLRTASELFMY